MCTVSMVVDNFRDKWFPDHQRPITPWPQFIKPTGPTKEEFEALKKEVLEMKELLREAKDYDTRTGQKDCEKDDKVAIIKKVAELVGVDLKDIALLGG